MPNDYFQFKQFTIRQDKCSFKVGTDAVMLGAAADITRSQRILDIGSGTGLIAIMLAQRSNADIIALEPDEQSFIQLGENIMACKWKERIKSVNCTLQEYNPGSRFDLIVSNPPYFINSLKNPDYRKSAARHNMNLSHSDLLKGVARLIEENGIFQLIMPFREGNALITEAGGYGLYCNEKVEIKPAPSSPVKRLILKFSDYATSLIVRSIIIETGQRHLFTDEYIALTQDFYLNFRTGGKPDAV